MTNSPYEPAFDGGKRILEEMRGRHRHPWSALHARANDPAQRHRMIAQTAYFRAERRRFEAGHELEDWLAAEAELEHRLRPEGDGAGAGQAYGFPALS